MKRRRILYVARKSNGGSAVSLYHLARGLDTSRYEPVVLFDTQERSDIGDRLGESGIKVIVLEKRDHESLPVPAGPVRRRDVARWLGVRFGRWASQAYVLLKSCYQFARWEAPKVWPIVRAIQQHAVDLVHLNTGLINGKAGIIAARLANTPCVCHVRMFDKLGHFDRVFARYVDYFVYISRAVAENYTIQGIPLAKGTVIHNAVDLSEFSTHDPAPVRSDLGFVPRERLVGVVGRLDWWKGHEYFLEAMAEVAQRIPNLRGLIVGAPEDTSRNREYYQKLQSLTKSLGLDGKVVFTGFRGDVPLLMSALDVVVLSSSAPEPFGRVVIEGMAAGKPVVATAAGGVLDIIEDGVNGLLVPRQDSRAMAEAVVELLSDREKARRMGLAARRRVEEKFTVQRHVAAVQQVYDAVLGTPQGQRAGRGHQDASDRASLKPLPGAESGGC